MKLLDARNLSAQLGGRQILHGVSLSLDQGQYVGLLGPNGSGKTTLIRAISGIIPWQGELAIAGKDANKISATQRARHMAVTPQNSPSPAGLTVMQFTLLGRFPWFSWLGFYGDRDYALATEALARVDLSQFAQRRLETLSGGEWQRALLGRALTQLAGQNLPLMLLDEFGASLDLFRSIELFSLLRRECGEKLGLLMALHDCNLAALFCTHLIGLKNGRILFAGKTTSVFTRENLSALYDLAIGIYPHPDLGLPQAYPHFAASAAMADRSPCGAGDKHYRR